MRARGPTGPPAVEALTGQHRGARAREGDAHLVPRLRDERDRGPGAARRARRPQAGAPPRALRDARPRPAAEPAVPQVRLHRRRGDGQVPPARRLGDLRHPGADGAGLLPALPARRRPGQLRLDRRRPAGGDAVHRGPPRPLATEMLRDIDADTVDFGPNYDERPREPLLLPARFPNLLVNGGAGIAVGMATNIPPHNLREVPARRRAFIDDPEIDLKGLMKHVKGPDFPGGGIIMGARGSATPTPRGAARSGSAPRRTSSRSRAARTRSSSPSSPSWSRRAATAA